MDDRDLVKMEQQKDFFAIFGSLSAVRAAPSVPGIFMKTVITIIYCNDISKADDDCK